MYIKRLLTEREACTVKHRTEVSQSKHHLACCARLVRTNKPQSDISWYTPHARSIIQ